MSDGMTPLWQRQAMNPANLETLWLLDAAHHLKFFAFHDVTLKAQLASAWAWCFETGNKPTASLALRSSEYVERFAERAESDSKAEQLRTEKRLRKLHEEMRKFPSLGVVDARENEDGSVDLLGENGEVLAGILGPNGAEHYERLLDAHAERVRGEPLEPSPNLEEAP